MNKQRLLPVIPVHPGSLTKAGITVALEPKRPRTADLAMLTGPDQGLSATRLIELTSPYGIPGLAQVPQSFGNLGDVFTQAVTGEYVPLNRFKKPVFFNDNSRGGVGTTEKPFDMNSLGVEEASRLEKRAGYYNSSRRRRRANQDLLDWIYITEYDAKCVSAPPFSSQDFGPMRVKLNQIFYKNFDTFYHAHMLLQEYGIKLLLIDSPENIPLTAFSFWSEENPAIAFPVNRIGIDQFAFRLLHHLGHIDLHMRNDRHLKFPDFEGMEDANLFEQQADAYARNSLIPEKVWEEILENHLPLNKRKIISLGKEFTINPVILLARAESENTPIATRFSIDREFK